ncbi:MAG: chorismate mutase [Oscillospiraceae bacterium]|nr:chorismate mutase [Oscillospiraceae bacterium]
MDLKDIRNHIDEIDDQMLSLFLERMACSEEVAKYKKEHGLPILNRAREREILEKVREKSGDKELYTHQFFTTLMNLSKASQSEYLTGDTQIKELTEKMLSSEESVFPKTGMVACQGVEGGNSQVAADRLFPRGNLIFVKTFEAVFQAVDSGLCKYGVVPIENSSNGSVRAVYELMQKYRFSILRSTRLWIHHTLLAKPNTKLEDIRTIYSHEQAIGQCSAYLNSLKNVQIIPCENTASAAKAVADSSDPHCAAIASSPCAELYGLDVLSDRIQDSENNYTRFICISKEPKMYEGADHISLIVSCDHRPGALHEILSKPAALGINMIKLESCPVSGRNFEFIFFIELEASLKEPGVIPMLEELERSSQELILLGNYDEV